MEEKLLREKNRNRVKDNNENSKNGANGDAGAENEMKPEENVLEAIVKLKNKDFYINISFRPFRLILITMINQPNLH